VVSPYFSLKEGKLQGEPIGVRVKEDGRSEGHLGMRWIGVASFDKISHQIVTGSSKELLENEVKPLIEEFLKVRGLELSPEKTRIIHITEGFDFLSGQSSSFVWPRQAFADTPRSKVKPTHMTQRGKTTLSNVWM
jgi:hypothetical protein